MSDAGQVAPLPGAAGYRLPAEWEPHAATWLSWPRNPDTWPGSFDLVPSVWTELTEVIAESEPVHILAGGEEVMADARERVGHLANVTLHDVPTNDAWIRDHGPMFLSAPDGAPAQLIDWDYDSWGGKYPPFDLDNAVPAAVAKRLGFTRQLPGMAREGGVVLEGGAIESNGAGTVLACASCLVGQRRNAGLSRDDMERLLRDYAGVRKVCWIEAAAGEAGSSAVGIGGDDTDGHIDQLARFVSPTRVVVAAEEDAGDANFAFLKSLWWQLSEATDADGLRFRLVRLPMPRPVIHEGQRLPASYANFYVTNRSLLVPQFADPADEAAREIVGSCFPDRKVHGFDSRILVRGLGGIHCVTLSQPDSR